MDHPLDPAGKVLAHAGVISDEAATMYSGTVTADADGAAMVRLPAWFDGFNADVRYQLTPIGAAMPALHVSQVVEAGRFRIAGAAPGGTVSWQLTGRRADSLRAAHRFEVEAVKKGRERGRYLHPVELGLPERKAVDYELREQARLAATSGSTASER